MKPCQFYQKHVLFEENQFYFVGREIRRICSETAADIAKLTQVENKMEARSEKRHTR